jgi:hypothetical protein
LYIHFNLKGQDKHPFYVEGKQFVFKKKQSIYVSYNPALLVKHCTIPYRIFLDLIEAVLYWVGYSIEKHVPVFTNATSWRLSYACIITAA